MPKSLLERGNPPAPMNREEDESSSDQDQDLSQQLEEAMEDTASIETQASQEDEEGYAENTANPPKTAFIDEEKGPSRENTLEDTLGGEEGPGQGEYSDGQPQICGWHQYRARGDSGEYCYPIR